MRIKKSSGFFELMLQNLYILIGAHYYTILFYYVKDVLIQPGDSSWLQDYYNLPTNLSSFNI